MQMQITEDFYKDIMNNDSIIAEQDVLHKILEDYFKFFTTSEGLDMTSYIYLDSHNYYDKLIRCSQEYYLCRDHIELISKHKDKFTDHLKDVTDIIEIGPGSDYVIRNKTMPILSYAKKLKNYHIIDNCAKYLHETSSIIKTHTSAIKIFTIEADLTQKEQINISHASNGKKCVLFLGGTLANFHEDQQNYCLRKIYNMLNVGDIFIVTADINQTEESLIAAYSNEHARNLFMGVIHYFAGINADFARYAKFFEMQTIWNKIESFVDISFVATKDFSFKFSNNSNIIVRKNQIFKGVRAYKKNKEENIELLKRNGFSIIDVLDNAQKIQEYICVKL